MEILLVLSDIIYKNRQLNAYNIATFQWRYFYYWYYEIYYEVDRKTAMGARTILFILANV